MADERSGAGDDRGEHDADLAGFAVPSGADPDHGRDDLERLASELADRVRAGAAFDPAAAAGGRPDLERRLREISPVVEALERWKALKAAGCGSGRLPATLAVERLGDCRLGREIGRGGNAIVVAAVQGDVWRRRVAVKVFPWRTAADGGEGRRRFLDEASTLARLQHRHVVPIYSSGSERGYSYYVMRLAEGGSLDRAIARPRPPGRPRRDRREGDGPRPGPPLPVGRGPGGGPAGLPPRPPGRRGPAGTDPVPDRTAVPAAKPLRREASEERKKQTWPTEPATGRDVGGASAYHPRRVGVYGQRHWGHPSERPPVRPQFDHMNAHRIRSKIRCPESHRRTS